MVWMRVVPIVLIVALLSSTASATDGSEAMAEGGEIFVLEGDPMVMSSITHSTNRSDDDAPWSVEVMLTSSATSNNTTLMLNTLICDISGFCYPPDTPPSVMTSNSNGSIWMGTVTPPVAHSYIRYKLTLTFPDDNTTQQIPALGYGGRVWSQCWYESEAADSRILDECPLDPSSDDGNTLHHDDDSGGLPAPATGLIIITLSCMALWRRDHQPTI